MSNKQQFYERAKEKENELRQEIERTEKIGGNDVFAMIISAFLVIFPITIIIIGLFSLFMLWLFGAIWIVAS